MSPAKAETLDFTKVTERNFNSKHMPEADYPAKVLKVDSGKSRADNKMWTFTIGISRGPGKGATYPLYCVLDANNLWKVRNLFTACGLNIPKKKLGLDPNKVVGRELGITLEDDEYTDKNERTKMKSIIAATIPLSEISSPDDEEDDGASDEIEEEAPKTSKKGKKDKGGKHGKGDKKKAKPAVDDEELEELEVEDL